MLFRQIIATTRLSIRRLLFTRFMVANLLLAALPIIILVLIGISLHFHRMSGPDIGTLHRYLEQLLRMFYLHFIIFFVAIISGFAIVRQDLDDRTLHYLILVPVPRWAVIVAKFIAFWVVTAATLLASLWLTYIIAMLIVAGPAATVRDLFGNELWFVVLLRESGVLLLAMTVYGAIGMAAGSVFKSLVFAPILWVWESALPWLPMGLKRLTLTHYFHSLLPFPTTPASQRGAWSAIEIVGVPATMLECFVVLTIVTIIAVGVALLVFWWRECAYVEEAA
ncbi:ABC transporter permease [bacterium]|nr:ABC transporter permease [bacterium]